jgi:hypothetical protein
MKAVNQSQRPTKVEGHEAFHVVNIYVPEECYSFARSHLRELIRQVEGDFPHASVVVVASECVSVGSVGFDLPPVYSRVLHDFVG